MSFVEVVAKLIIRPPNLKPITDHLTTGQPTPRSECTVLLLDTLPGGKCHRMLNNKSSLLDAVIVYTLR